MKSFDANGGVVTFEKNSKWWGDPGKLDTIVFKTVSRDGVAQAYGNKELDAFNLNGSADNLKTANSRSDSKIERSLGTTQRQITLNGTSDVFKDQDVRQAFAQAINRKVVAQAILSPVKSPGDVLNNLVYLPGQQGYEDDASSVYGYSTDKAKSKLEDAGWKIGSDGYATKGGKELDVRFVIPSDNPNSANVAQLVQQQTKLAGFKVTIDTVPTDDFFTKYVTTSTRDFDATYFAWQGTPFPDLVAEVDLLPRRRRPELQRRDGRLARRRLGQGERRTRRGCPHQGRAGHRQEDRRGRRHHPAVRRAVRLGRSQGPGELRSGAVPAVVGQVAGRRLQEVATPHENDTAHERHPRRRTTPGVSFCVRARQNCAAARDAANPRTTSARIVQPWVRCVIGAAVTDDGGGPSCVTGAGTWASISAAAASTSRRSGPPGRSPVCAARRAVGRVAIQTRRMPSLVTTSMPYFVRTSLTRDQV
ncbi:ABC transporter substrate-binding protein [Curtobacterium flaccumfaciens]|nr:ABC transporter substrate-binding protein [Curtobacterium flaccumfaciens]